MHLFIIIKIAPCTMTLIWRISPNLAQFTIPHNFFPTISHTYIFLITLASLLTQAFFLSIGKKGKLIWRKKCIFDSNVTFSRLSRHFLTSLFLPFLLLLFSVRLFSPERVTMDGKDVASFRSIGRESLFVEANVNQLHLNRSKSSST